MAMHLHMFRSGSSGNSGLLVAGRTRLLIDAGIGPRVLAKELALLGLGVRDLTGVVFTHCHSDHLRGPTMALFAREGVPVYMNPGTWEAARRREANAAMDQCPPGLVRLFEAEAPFGLGDLEVTAFRVNHGQPGPGNPAGDPVGFVMRDGVDTFGYCTDLGQVTETVLAHLRPADMLVLECNHDVEMVRLSARPWMTKQWIIGEAGHLNNHQAASALAELFEGRERAGILLAHLSEQCNTQGLARGIATDALAGRADVAIGIAGRHHSTVPWTLDRGVARPIADWHPAGLFL